MQPLVSAIVPVRDGVSAGPGFLRQALDSLLYQDWDGPLEIIVVDDGSKDGTFAAIQEWSGEVNRFLSRRLVLERTAPQGVTKALNTGLAKASGEFVVRQDADDFSQPDRIRKQLAYLAENPDVALVGSAVRAVHSKPSNEVWYRRKEPRVSQKEFLQGTPFCHGSVTIRRSVLQEVGGYDTRYVHAQDYDLFWRIAKLHPVAALPEVLYNYRVHNRRITSKPDRFRIQLECARDIRNRISQELEP